MVIFGSPDGKWAPSDRTEFASHSAILNRLRFGSCIQIAHQKYGFIIIFTASVIILTDSSRSSLVSDKWVLTTTYFSSSTISAVRASDAPGRAISAPHRVFAGQHSVAILSAIVIDGKPKVAYIGLFGKQFHNIDIATSVDHTVNFLQPTTSGLF